MFDFNLRKKKEKKNEKAFEQLKNKFLLNLKMVYLSTSNENTFIKLLKNKENMKLVQ